MAAFPTPERPGALRPTRYPGFDALRALMMLLGIAFHLAIPYANTHYPGYYSTLETSPFLRLFLILHYLRMPTFFLLSGFLSAMLWDKLGPERFLRTRARRLGLVWLIALPVLWLLMIPVCVYVHFASFSATPLASSWMSLRSLNLNPKWFPDLPLHLWFLEYLLMFCGVAVLGIRIFAKRLPALDHWTGFVLRSRMRVLVLALPTTITRSRVPFAIAPYPSSLLPWLGISLEYGWYFAVGWCVFRRRDLFARFVTASRFEQSAVPISIVVWLLVARERVRVGYGVNAPFLDLMIACVTAIFIWSTIFVLVAAVQKLPPWPWLPYLADASYWIYIAHYPLACLMPALMRHVPFPPVVKVACSAVLIFVFLLWVYSKFVRYSFLGRALNGVRERKELPHSVALQN